MEYTNIRRHESGLARFTLIRTRGECKQIRKDIGEETDFNISLFAHFSEGAQPKRMAIDFEMITHLETEAGYHPNSKILTELQELMIKLQKEKIVSEWLR